MNEWHVLSLGAGVQSTAVLLMSEVGDLPPLDVAVFADTGWEPAAVYRNLDWLERTCKTPIVRVQRGSLRDTVVQRAEGGRAGGPHPPFFILNRRGFTGQLHRGCTRGFKIRPIEKYLRAHREGREVHQWLGISYDEATRMRDARPPVDVNEYPLVDRRMTRWDCVRWLEAHGYPVPQKSACLGCPYHSQKVWQEMRQESPEEWADTVEVDRKIRHLPKLEGPVFMHSSALPLEEAVKLPEGEQLDLFGEECSGLCGV